MSVSLIPNQPVRFRASTEIEDDTCGCMGQPFCQLVENTDPTAFEIRSTDLIVNGGFEIDLDGWGTTGTGWAQGDDVSAACHVGGANLDTLYQEDVFEVGKLYSVKFEVLLCNCGGGTDVFQGKVVVTGITGTHEYTAVGEYEIIGIADGTDLTFTATTNPDINLIVFNACVDSVEARNIPLYSIIDPDNNSVLTQTDDTGVVIFGDFIRYLLDWSEIASGCYRIKFENTGIEYISDCLRLKENHSCSLLLSWTNEENAFGFNYSDIAFNPVLRIKGKLWKPRYEDDKKEVFIDSAGNRDILYVRKAKEQKLTISDAPEYIHDAIDLGRDHDTFTIEGVQYVNEENEYEPAWRNPSQLASAEMRVVKQGQNLVNNNC